MSHPSPSQPGVAHWTAACEHAGKTDGSVCDQCGQPAHHVPCPLCDRETVLAALGEVYTLDGMAIWMVSRNPMLKDRIPNEMIEQGDADQVLDLIEALASGAVL